MTPGSSGSKIQVTSLEVRYTAYFFVKMACPREPVRMIHWFSAAVAFEGAGHAKLMRAGAGWTKDRLLDISEALGVPLFNQRTRMGLSDERKGQLVQR